MFNTSPRQQYCENVPCLSARTATILNATQYNVTKREEILGGISTSFTNSLVYSIYSPMRWAWPRSTHAPSVEFLYTHKRVGAGERSNS